MTAFLSTHLDFILFCYGLAFILFGATCIAIDRIGEREEPWISLGLFGFFHGGSEWLDLTAMVAGHSWAFDCVRLAVMTTSFVWLMEFARREAIRLGWKAPALPLYIPLLALVAAAAMIDGINAAGAIARYIFGFFGAVAVALAFARLAQTYSGLTKRLSMCVATGFAAYAVAAGAIVPAGTMWPTTVVNYDWFIHLTGVPIQLVRGMLACYLAFCIWSIWGQHHIVHVHVAQRLTEKKIRVESEQMARAIINTSLDAFLQLDESGTVIDWSPKAEAMFGWSRGEAIGRDLRDLFIPPERRGAIPERLAKLLKNARQGGPGWRFEAPALRRDGTLIDTEVSLTALERDGRYIINAFLRDITDRVRTERERSRTRELLNRIIENITAAILVKDARDWRYVLVNKAAEELWGLPREQIIGKTPREIFEPATADAIEANDRRSLETKSNYFIGEHSVLAPDGRTRLVTSNRLVIFDHKGKIEHILGVVEDVTERRAVEDQLRQAQKMESIGRITGGIAHDFNNMLTVITGTIDILADAVKDNPQLAAIAKLSSETADHGAELTGHLLAFARKQPLQPREIDVNALMVESKNLLHRTLGEQIDIRLRLSKDAWSALVDPTQLTTALLNLAINARDAMPNGGTLTLETGKAAFDRSYADANKDVEPGDYVVIRVSDTGGGIAEAIRHRVFEPFFTTKEVGEGTGLGLSMVYGFVKQSKGHIRLDSGVGCGTTFELYLPRAAAGAAEAAEELPEATLEAGTETILMVEDDPLVSDSVATQLHSLGYRILTAANAAEALAIADTGEPFDLLFTDIVMHGGMNGRGLAEEMAKRRSPLKVLFTSGYSENALMQHGRLDPGVHLLAKPYRKSDLAGMLRQTLAGTEAFPPPDRDQRLSQTA